MPRLCYLHQQESQGFPKGTVYTALVEADANPGEGNWDTLERNAATYEVGSQGHFPETFSGNNT